MRRCRQPYRVGRGIFRISETCDGMRTESSSSFSIVAHCVRLGTSIQDPIDLFLLLPLEMSGDE